ncbi:MAG: type II secretion system protein GspC [Gammaproteobacteria bacterium]|nr:type II secretion system protein GspC [Gammaproteobacteria bacterium]MBU2059209.1 type II secretion system protein GspC [Gammaproteobacteria bacterium]MBU2173760.1 type II secretion system protein GspC [Gammaproteobacteria bacterium]MBU2246916.1 type II secretion system protein GspC [Gammaproteobacteria bacterium]MBU2343486.1 type II secretion system protein GspC [Gammaproteobacteria bacterium]
MNWSASTQPAIEWLNRLPQQRLNFWLSGLFVVLFCWLLAKLSWQLLPVPQAEAISAAVTVTGQTAPDLKALLDASLFGKASEQAEVAPVAAPTTAPKTTLNVKLTGVVAIAGKPDQGSAVIESQGSEQTYGVDDKIEGTSASLSQVFEDRVLLKVSSRFETLMLDGIEFQHMVADNGSLQEVDYRPQPEPMMDGPQPPMEELADVRQEMMSEPMKFFDYIRASPQYRNGQLYGYRVMPGKDPALFERMGLKANDVAVEINGTPLNDMQQAMMVMNELREATQASIKVERDGQTRDIVFSLSQ